MDGDKKSIEILMIEDNSDDADLMADALQQQHERAHVQVVEDGDAALAYLRRSGAFSSAPRPDLILLDLNLPKKSGHELLAEIKSDPSLKRIPVIILTTSSSELDVMSSYNLGANCYITKPLDLDRFTSIVGAIDKFWLRTATLSPR
jgi:DNA-binding response OmpR family regulator